MNETRHGAKAPLGRRILGSALAALVGWLALNVPLFVWALVKAVVTGRYSDPAHSFEWWVGPAFVAMYSAAFIFGAWLIALMPLYLLVPRTSMLWRWPLCTACGAATGALIMFGFLGPNSRDSSSTTLILLAAFVGAVTCLFAALTAARYHRATP